MNGYQRNRSYVLVTPVRDEAGTIGRTIGSVASQTLLPREWVIVDDGSTDGTTEILRDAASRHPWIRPIRLSPRDGRCFAAVVHNTTEGIRQLESEDHGFLGLLDADVTFQADYYERLIERFEEDPTLGLAGGVVIDVGTPRDRFPRNRTDVPGAVQFFRRECFDSLGGLLPIPEGGWDGMTCAVARMNGYSTRLFTDLIVDHHKPRNISQGGVVRRKWQMGFRDRAAGYHPLFEFVKCVSRIPDSPFFIGAAAWWVGFCAASFRNSPRVVPPVVVEHVRREQMARLAKWISFRHRPPGWKPEAGLRPS